MSHQTYRSQIYTRGMTLIEVMVTLVIFSLIVVVLSTFQKNVFVNNQFVSDSLTTAQDARQILRVITRELRTAAIGNNGAYPIVQAATSSVTFFADIDSDGLKEQVRYFLTGTVLKKGVIKPTGMPLTYVPANEQFSILSSNVRNSTSTALFLYYGSSYDGTTAPYSDPVTLTLVRLVKINLILDANINKAPVSQSYASQVSLRNLKDNL